jgi:hypothetical protein
MIDFLKNNWWDYSESLKYPFLLKKLLTFEVRKLKSVDNFYTGFGKLENGVLTIFPDYAWNGCTPKWKVWGLMIGTPEGWRSSTKRASVVHDFLTQYNVCRRSLADRIFYDMLKEDSFYLAKLYYLAVRLYSVIFVNVQRWFRK